MDTNASGNNGEQARLSWVTYCRGAESCARQGGTQRHDSPLASQKAFQSIAGCLANTG